MKRDTSCHYYWGKNRILNHPALAFCSLLSTAVYKQNLGEMEMPHCPSSACTERADCKPNTLFARGKDTLLACWTPYAHVCIQAPWGDVIFVVSTTSHSEDPEKELVLWYLILEASLTVVPPAWSGACWAGCVYLMTQLGSFPCNRRDAPCHLSQPFICFTLDSSNSRNSETHTHTSPKSPR